MELGVVINLCLRTQDLHKSNEITLYALQKMSLNNNTHVSSELDYIITGQMWDFLLSTGFFTILALLIITRVAKDDNNDVAQQVLDGVSSYTHGMAVRVGQFAKTELHDLRTDVFRLADGLNESSNSLSIIKSQLDHILIVLTSNDAMPSAATLSTIPVYASF